jgi:hypothetical protein
VLSKHFWNETGPALAGPSVTPGAYRHVGVWLITCIFPRKKITCISIRYHRENLQPDTSRILEIGEEADRVRETNPMARAGTAARGHGVFLK